MKYYSDLNKIFIIMHQVLNFKNTKTEGKLYKSKLNISASKP